MTTLRDLSRHLGLSVTQVSRALNGHSDVKHETRERVIAAAKALRYQPNLSARTLATGRSGMVGLVMQGKPTSPTEEYFVEMLTELSAFFSQRERQFVLHIAGVHENIIDVYRRLVDGGGIAGFVLLSPSRNDPRVAFLEKRSVPYVLHGRIDEGPDTPVCPFYDIDNRVLGETLTRHLIDHGHQRIAFLNGPKDLTYAEWRREGHERALTAAGIPLEPALHHYGDMTEAFGMITTLRLLSGANPPTAIICGNTLIAKGAYQTITALGLAIGRDISVISHDDALPSIYPATFHPALTTTYSPLAQSWLPIAELLLNRLDGIAAQSLQILGETAFIARDSVGPCPEVAPPAPVTAPAPRGKAQAAKALLSIAADS